MAYDDFFYYYYDTLVIFTMVINICEFVVGFVGNITACVVISFNRSMHTLTNFYLLSLSTADLLILITGTFHQICSHVPRLKWTSHLYTNNVEKYVRDWIFNTSVNVSILTVTTFTMERYLAICHPFLVQSMAGTSRVKKILTSIWLTGAALALLPTAENFFRINHRLHTPLKRIIAVTWPYVLYICVVVYFVLPMLLIIVMYVLIWIKLNKRSHERGIASQSDRVDVRALKMFVIIIVAFFISWAPYYAEALIWYHIRPSLEHSYPAEEEKILETLGVSRLIRDVTYSLSSVLNPIIYVIMSEKFRETCKDLLSISWKKLSGWTSIFTNTPNNEIPLESTL